MCTESIGRPETNDESWIRLKVELREENNICFYCSTPNSRSIDHKVPVKVGGSNDRSNLVISCYLCNRLKDDNSLDFYEEFVAHYLPLIRKVNSIDKELSAVTDELKTLQEFTRKIIEGYLQAGLLPGLQNDENLTSAKRNERLLLKNRDNLLNDFVKKRGFLFEAMKYKKEGYFQ